MGNEAKSETGRMGRQIALDPGGIGTAKPTSPKALVEKSLHDHQIVLLRYFECKAKNF